MKELTDDQFYKSLIKYHEPEVIRNTHVAVEQYYIRCNACNAHEYSIWHPGDPEIMCKIWREHLRREKLNAGSSTGT